MTTGRVGARAYIRSWTKWLCRWAALVRSWVILHVGCGLPKVRKSDMMHEWPRTRVVGKEMVAGLVVVIYQVGILFMDAL